MFIGIICERGISSNGRVRALHARGSGIDSRILHFLNSDMYFGIFREIIFPGSVVFVHKLLFY